MTDLAVVHGCGHINPACSPRRFPYVGSRSRSSTNTNPTCSPRRFPYVVSCNRSSINNTRHSNLTCGELKSTQIFCDFFSPRQLVPDILKGQLVSVDADSHPDYTVSLWTLMCSLGEMRWWSLRTVWHGSPLPCPHTIPSLPPHRLLRWH
jgi:hypothetical protein